MKFLSVKSNSDYSRAQDFLVPYEQWCVSLMEAIRRKEKDIYIITDDSDIVSGIITADHTVLHCIPNAQKNRTELLPSLASFFNYRHVSCVNGEADGTKIILEALAARKYFPAQTNFYSLMISCMIPSTAAIIPPEGFCIERCRLEHANLLMPLQLAYEKEEVLPTCRKFDPSVIRFNLERTLRTEYVLAIRTTDGKFIAKANTNSIGVNCIQIGGVYTIPEFRRRKFASLLISCLSYKIINIRRIPVLFVKKENAVAEKLYKTLGFSPITNYCIAYF